MKLENGINLFRAKNFNDAINVFLKLESKNKENHEVDFYLGLCYFELNSFNKSIKHLKRSIKFKPNFYRAIYNLALVYQTLGKINLAKKFYLKLLKENKYFIRPYIGLYNLNPSLISKEYYPIISQISKNKNSSDFEKSLAEFMLSKIEKKKRNYTTEIKYLKNYHSLCFNSNFELNSQSEFYYDKIISRFYNKIQFNNFSDKNNFSNIKPIFIIGLPRSGSTLIETILTSSEKKLKTCGESNIFNMCIVENIREKIFSRNFNINEETLYIDHLKICKNIKKKYKSLNILENDFFLDKSLENFFNIEVILKIMPNAKFIHSFRNYNDAIISIYQSSLHELSWSHKISSLTKYVDNYLKIINFFKQKYKNKILDVKLEDLTKSQESVFKNIFNFCSLKWDKKFLDLKMRKNSFVKTLSGVQVRKKISKYDLKKYEPYYYLLKDYKNKYEWLNI